MVLNCDVKRNAGESESRTFDILPSFIHERPNLSYLATFPMKLSFFIVMLVFLVVFLIVYIGLSQGLQIPVLAAAIPLSILFFLNYYQSQTFMKNPHHAYRVRGAEFLAIHDALQGEWTTSKITQSSSLPCIYTDFYTSSMTKTFVRGTTFTQTQLMMDGYDQEFSTDISVSVNHNSSSITTNFGHNILLFRTKSGRFFFGEYGTEIFEMQLPIRMKMQHWDGSIQEWERPKKNETTVSSSSNITFGVEIIPAGMFYKTKTPAVDNVKPTLSTRLQNLEHLRDNELLNSEEFDNAKAKAIRQL